jgi:hypothetical protein
MVASVSEIAACASRYIRLLTSEVIAVELSGGLDTAIIIGVARLAGCSPKLIGVVSDRYEFRTERIVQGLVPREGDTVVLIKEEDALPFSELVSTPSHPVPNKFSLFYQHHVLTRRAAQEIGVRHVLNGIGCDFLLCNEVSPNGFSKRFEKWELDDPWPDEHVYAPYGLRYINAGSLNVFRLLAWRLRSGQLEDTQKLWAREFFSYVLPNELVKYTYKGSFDGMYEDGLRRAMEPMGRLAKVAYDVTRNELLHPNALYATARGYSTLTHEEEIVFMARLSFANWIYTLVRDGCL